MKLKSNNAGFTLIEIIVVLIIVGVLAAIALPNLFGNVARSRSAEALSTLGTIKTQVEGCWQGQNGATGTLPAACIFAVANSPNFGYTISTVGAAQALVIAVNGTVGTVQLSRAAGQAGAWTCSATGTYAGVC